MRLTVLLAAALALVVGACTTGSLDDLSKGGPKKNHSSGGHGGQSVDGGPDAVVSSGGSGAGGQGGAGPGLPCSDHLLGDDETDVDCGGVCPPCDVGLKCKVNADCTGGSCTDGLCQDASCTDGVSNAG